MHQKMKNLRGREDAKLFKHSTFSTRTKVLAKLMLSALPPEDFVFIQESA